MLKIKNINSFIATDCNKLFNVNVEQNDGTISNITFFADTEQDNSFDKQQKSNKNCLQDVDFRNQLIHNMYQSDCVYYKSAIYKLSKTARNDNTYDFQNIFNHKLSTQLTNIIKVDNTIYALEFMTPFGHYTISDDIYSYLSCINGKIIPNNNTIKTTIYDKNYIVNQLSTNKDIDADSAILSNLENINYNMIYEIPGNIYNDYDSGNIIANTFKTKNQYDSEYDMSHSGLCILTNARQYTQIASCNKQVYLKYIDNLSYANQNSNYSVQSLGGKHNLKYEHIEYLNSINRFSKLNGHSTNLYNITLKTDILGKIDVGSKNSDLKTLLKNNIITEIQNCVRTITEQLAPAQSQLLSVYVYETK